MSMTRLAVALLLDVVCVANLAHAQKGHGGTRGTSTGSFEKALASPNLPEYANAHPAIVEWVKTHPQGLGALAQHPRLDEVVEDHPQLLASMAGDPQVAQLLASHPHIAEVLAVSPGALDTALEKHPELLDTLAKHPAIEALIEARPPLVTAILARPASAQTLAQSPRLGAIAARHPSRIEDFQKVSSTIVLPERTMQVLKDPAEALREATDPNFATRAEAIPGLAYAVAQHPEAAAALARRPDLEEIAARQPWIVSHLARQPGVTELLASHERVERVLASDPQGFGLAIAQHADLALAIAQGPRAAQIAKDHPEVLSVIAHHPRAAAALQKNPQVAPIASSLPRVARRLALAKTAPPPIPAIHQAQYGELSRALDGVEAFLASHPASGEGESAYMAELLMADGGAGTAVLDPKMLQDLPDVLDSLKRLGFDGVKVQVMYPMLLPEFPRASEYVAVYRKVAEEVRRHDMKLFVEFASFVQKDEPAQWSYRGLTMETYTKGLTKMAQAVVREMGPDALSLLNEPDTRAANTGLDFSPAACVALVQEVMRALPRGGAAIAAGAGTWSPMEYFEALAGQTSVDLIDVHIRSAAGGEMTTQMDAIHALCERSGKAFSASETWLRKDGGEGKGTAATKTVRGLETFSFWEPLDERFVSYMIELSRLYRLKYCGFFAVARYLYAYNAYDPSTASLSPPQLLDAEDQAAASARRTGEVSPLGLDLPDLLGE